MVGQPSQWRKLTFFVDESFPLGYGSIKLYKRDEGERECTAEYGGGRVMIGLSIYQVYTKLLFNGTTMPLIF